MSTTNELEFMINDRVITVEGDTGWIIRRSNNGYYAVELENNSRDFYHYTELSKGEKND